MINNNEHKHWYRRETNGIYANRFENLNEMGNFLGK